MATRLATLALAGVGLSFALGYDVPAVLAAFAESKLGQILGVVAAGLGALAVFVGLVILFIASGYNGMIKNNKPVSGDTKLDGAPCPHRCPIRLAPLSRRPTRDAAPPPMLITPSAHLARRRVRA